MPEASGHMADRRHVFPLRVYYEDTDAAGVVYYANYLRFAERARTEFLRGVGARHRDFLDSDSVMFTVRRCEVDYVRPAVLDDALEVHTEVTDLRGASMWMAQTVRRGEADLARLKVRIACVTRQGRPARFPDSLLEAVKPYCAAEFESSEQRA